MKIATTTADFGGYCKTAIERIRELHRAGFHYIDFSMYYTEKHILSAYGLLEE